MHQQRVVVAANQLWCGSNRVDELDTLVQQYRGTIWSYEAKIEGLEKALDGFRDTAAAAAGAHGAPVDLDQFAVTGH